MNNSEEIVVYDQDRDVKNTMITCEKCKQALELVDRKSISHRSIRFKAFNSLISLAASEIDEFLRDYARLIWDEAKKDGFTKVYQTNTAFFQDTFSFIVFLNRMRDGSQSVNPTRTRLAPYSKYTSIKKFSDFLNDLAYEITDDQDVNEFM